MARQCYEHWPGLLFVGGVLLFCLAARPLTFRLLVTRGSHRRFSLAAQPVFSCSNCPNNITN